MLWPFKTTRLVLGAMTLTVMEALMQMAVVSLALFRQSQH